MRCWWTGAALLAACLTTYAQASEPTTPSPITDHFALSGIFFWGHVDTTGQFNSAAGVPGTPFSAENELGLTDKDTEPTFEIVFRLEQRSRFRVDFMDVRRGGDKQLNETIQYGDQTFQEGDEVQSELDWRQTDFTYTYSFLRNDRFELGAGIGVHLIEVSATAQVPHTAQRADYTAAGPFATVALDGILRLTKHWALSVRGQYLKLTIDSTSGMLGIYHADLQYRWRPNLAFGAGYQYQRVEVDVRNQDPSGILQMNISGPELFARMSF